ncbi:MAG: hypothetical protein Q4G43_08005 [Mobilicoccus sp.]|nr:hypothetical protein [Mobilicoccus sp.]
MFKSKKKKVAVPTIDTRTITVPTAHGIKDAVGAYAAVAKDKTADAARDAEKWAKPYIEQGLEFAEEQAHKAKDKVESTGSFSDLAAKTSATREEAAKRSRDAALVLKGEAVAKKKKGGFGKVLSTLTVLTVLGAVAAYVAQKLTQPKDDPWARPLTDPYIAPPTGRDSTSTSSGAATGAAGRDATVAAGEGVKVTEVGEAADQERDIPAGEVITPAEGTIPATGAPVEGEKRD